MFLVPIVVFAFAPASMKGVVRPVNYNPQSVAIVTGVSSAVGFAVANMYGKMGYDLLISTDTCESVLCYIVNRLQTAHPKSRVVCVEGDISDVITRAAIFETYSRRFAPNPLRVMVHNCAEYTQNVPECKNNEDKYRAIFNEAYQDLCVRTVPLMDTIGGGSIVGISSPKCTPYSFPQTYSPLDATQDMEDGMHRVLQRAAASGTNINVVVPGLTRVESWENAISKRRGPSSVYINMHLPNAPMGPIMPNEIAKVVAFLGSKSGRCITGCTISADNGLHA